MNKLISFYKSQRQKFWTHILLPFTFVFWSIVIILYTHFALSFITNYDISGSGMYLFVTMLIYGHILPIILVIAIIEFFLKTKIKNKFFTENKIYGIIWNIGNLLAFIFVMFLVIIYIYSQLLKYHIIQEHYMKFRFINLKDKNFGHIFYYRLRSYFGVQLS